MNYKHSKTFKRKIALLQEVMELKQDLEWEKDNAKLAWKCYDGASKAHGDLRISMDVEAIKRAILQKLKDFEDIHAKEESPINYLKFMEFKAYCSAIQNQLDSVSWWSGPSMLIENPGPM